MGKVVDALVGGTPLGKLAWDAVGVDAWWEIGVGKYIREALIPVPDSSFNNDALGQQQMVRSPIEPRRSIYGRAMVSGPMTYVNETGKDNEYLHFVIPLAAHRCAGIDEIYFNDEQVYSNGKLDVKYKDHARINIHLGEQTTADSDLIAECSSWTSAHVGFGITYLYVRLKHDPEFFTEGLPNIKALVKGKPLYDPRLDSSIGGAGSHRLDNPATWAWSDNWALCVLDYTLFESGVGARPAEVDFTSYALAASDSDQLIEYNDAGDSEKRYTCNGTITQAMTPASVLDKLLTAGGGMQSYLSGKYQLFSGVYQGPYVLELGENDLAGSVEIRPFNPRANLCNAVRGTFVDPDNFYQPTDFPPYESDYYRAQDSDEYIDHDVDLPFTQSLYTAQRLAKLYLELNRAAQQVTLPLNMIGLSVSVGQVVKLNLPRLGINAEYQVVDWDFDFGQPCKVTLRETSIPLFEYDKGSYTTRPLTPALNLPSAKNVPTVSDLVWIALGDDANWQGTLTWSAPGGNSAYRYHLEVRNTAQAIVYQSAIEGTRHNVPKLDAGTYTLTLWAVNLFANRSNVPASIVIGADAPPTITSIQVDAGALELVLRPQTAALIAQTTVFELVGSLSNQFINALPIGQGKEVVWPSRHANTVYYVWARSINNFGAGTWFGPVPAQTSADKSALVELLGDTFKKFTWFAWADDASGTGFTTVEVLGDGKAYMGIATDKETASPSGNWQDYTWSKIRSEIPPLFTPEEETKLDNLMAGKLPFAPDKDMLAAQDALNNPALANNLITALALLNQGVNASSLGGETPSGAQSKASSAQSAAIAAAAADATSKANNAKAQAEANAALDALNKKNEAISAASSDATAKVDAVKVGGVNLFENSANIVLDKTVGGTNAEHGFFASIQHVIDKIDNDEHITISFDIDSVYGNSLHCYNSNRDGERVFAPSYIFQNFGPNKVRLAFTTKIVNNTGTINSPGDTWIEFYSIYGTGDFWKISKLKIERGTKATDWSPAPEDHYDYTDAAKNAAIAAAATDATTKANNAKAQAQANAALDALNKVNAAKADAISTAATDAQAKASAAQSAAIAASAPAYKDQKTVNFAQFSDYQYRVIPICRVIQASDGNSNPHMYTTGKFVFKRNAGNGQLVEVFVNAQCGYNSSWNMFDYEESSNVSGVSPVTFFKNGVQYFGVAIKVSAQFQINYFVGSHFDGFGDLVVFSAITYFTANNSAIIDSEIYNSITDYVSNRPTKSNSDFVVNGNTLETETGSQTRADSAKLAAIGDVAAGRFAAQTALITTLFANSGLFNQLQSRLGVFGGLTANSIAALAIATNHLQAGAVTVDKVGANAITAQKIAALAIATNHLQAGVVTADKITADTALIQKLIANVGLFNQLQAQLGAFGGLAANSIAAGAITVDKLDVRAKNLVNNVSQTGVITGWSGGVVVDHTHKGKVIKALQVSSAGDTQILSDLFDIDHTKIYEVNFTIHRVSGGATGSRYLGIYADGDGLVNLVSPDTRTVGSSTHNFYFWSGGIADGQYRQMRAYIIGSEVDPASIPDSLNVNVCCLLNPSTKQVRLRALNYYNYGVTTVDRWLNISVSELGGGQISANQLLANSGLFNQLKARLASFGGLTATEIQADTALINKIIGTSALFNDLIARIAVFGGLTANSIAADAILGRHIKAGEKITSPIIEGGELRLIGTAYMKVQSASPFGPDGLVEWYGPKLLVSGNPNWAALRKSNAITYLAANGDAYFGGSLSAGVLKTGVSNTMTPYYTVNSYPVEIGPFGTNGKPKVIVVSYALSGDSWSTTQVSNPTQPSLSWQLQRKIGSGSWASVSSGVFNGSCNVTYDGESRRWFTAEHCQGSSTYTDNSTLTSDFSYRILVTGVTRYHATANVNNQILSLISTEQ